LRELIEYAKKNPGKVSYGTPGAGTAQHLSGVVIGQLMGGDWLHVPYKGSPPATDLITNRIQLAINTSSFFVPLIQAGRIKLLAINENRRLAAFPDVASVFEIVPGYEHVPSWFGYFVTAGTPLPIVERLAAEIERAVKVPDVRAKIEASGSLINTLGPDEFAAQLKRLVEVAGRLVKRAGIKPGAALDQ
jgi:tripartite-type tricarboxylate transporter receptor subunit TctC